MDSSSGLSLMIIGVILLVGENWIVNQVKRIHKPSVPLAKIIILFSSFGGTIAGVLTEIVQNHVDVYIFFPIYGLLLFFFMKRSLNVFKKIKTKVGKIAFIIPFSISGYFLGAIGIYVYYMAPYAKMM